MCHLKLSVSGFNLIQINFMAHICARSAETPSKNPEQEPRAKTRGIQGQLKQKGYTLLLVLGSTIFILLRKMVKYIH